MAMATALSRAAGYWPILGPALQRVTHVSPDSVILDAYQEAFAPGLRHLQRLREPRPACRGPARDDLHGLRRHRRGRERLHRRAPLDDRLSAIEVPLLVVFGAEDQIYDAEEAIEPYEDIAGAQTELLDGVGHSPQRRDPERMVDRGFIARTEAAARAARRAEAAKEARKRGAPARPPAPRPGRRRRPGRRTRPSRSRHNARAERRSPRIGAKGWHPVSRPIRP